MSDITDQEKRDLLDWANSAVADSGRGKREPWVAAAQFILATVEPPAPTLSEELLAPDGVDEDVDGETWVYSPERMRGLAARAERDAALKEARLAREASEMTEADRQSREMIIHRQSGLTAGALAEIEQLRQEQPSNGNGAKLERGNELPTIVGTNPADVPPGETWRILVEEGEAVGVRTGPELFPWSVIFLDGFADEISDTDITLVTRLVPAPRVITKPEELDELRPGAIIRDGRGWPGGVTDQGVLMINGSAEHLEEVAAHGPVTVLWEPEEES